MRDATEVIALLRRRGLLWEHAPGLYGLRGAPLRLMRRLDTLIRRCTLSLSERREWQTPPALGLETLAAADYFASFPQWLTLAAHLSDDESKLAAVAAATEPASAAAAAALPARVALPPAACYHVYAAVRGRTLSRPLRAAVRGTCWRHEGAHCAPLERGWAFTMHEAVLLGGELQVEQFREGGVQLARALAASLELQATVESATDPFFAPTARGKALLQRAKGLKHELRLPIGERTVAAASFNHHETFFGSAFEIRLPSGKPAHSGCVAFGVERWLLAFLVRHGVDPRSWPPLPRTRELQAT